MDTGWIKSNSGPLWDQKGDEKMRKLTLLSSLVVAALALGLSMNQPAAAEQSTVEPGAVSSDVSKVTPSSLALDSEDMDSALDLKRGRIGGGRPAMRPAARPMGRPAGHLGRPIGHHGPRPAHTRIAHHPGRLGHHPGHHIHHPGHRGHHPGHHIHHPRHHHRLPLGAVSWVEPATVGGVSLVEIEETECTQCPTRIRPVCQVCEPEETEVETEELEQNPEEEER
jgi:hypothetical protein